MGGGVPDGYRGRVGYSPWILEQRDHLNQGGPESELTVLMGRRGGCPGRSAWYEIDCNITIFVLHRKPCDGMGYALVSRLLSCRVGNQIWRPRRGIWLKERTA